MPAPVGQGARPVDPLAADLGGEDWAEAAPPEPHGFMADLDASLVQQVFDVAQRERKADLHHYRQANDLRARLEVLEWGGSYSFRMAMRQLSPTQEFCSD